MSGLPMVDLKTTDPYVAYSYSYPHKSAYGPLDPPLNLGSIWENEPRNSLFLYVHIPFCEMRCGFCNLFTQANASHSLVTDYLDSLDRQSEEIADLLGEATFSRFALGGGTPTILNPGELDWLFDLISRRFRASPQQIPTSVEVSPSTVTKERLGVLENHGVRRVSIGVQSFLDEEVHRIGRPQDHHEVQIALDLLREFPILNIDLIYGQPGQTLRSWERSLFEALEYSPEELFLYPLYVRPLTGVGKQGRLHRSEDNLTLSMYQLGRDLLISRGYEQISMRCFRKKEVPFNEGPTYCCQQDGMVGIGCGARSYTREIHYSTPFAVEASDVQKIIRKWIATPAKNFGLADWGVRLSEDDRKRRFLIQSMLQHTGVNETSYLSEFAASLIEDFPILRNWADEGLAQEIQGHWTLTPKGMERSDFIGPALYSQGRLLKLQEFAQC